MFYSHEILTSRQYGVATIWLVATTGNRASARKITRKAIQEVDVEKACSKILEPGAPIALRLQGSLLLGVSKVFDQQCAYMMNDAKKIQNHMNMFFGELNNNQLDPNAGFARPENLLLMNDPDFVPDMQLPKLDYDEIIAAQASQKTSSQMSPRHTSQLSGSGSSGRGFPIQLELGLSDSSGPRTSPFVLEGLFSDHKAGNEQPLFPQEEDFAEDVVDWGLEIDEFGNIVERPDPTIVQDEPELPPLPPIDDEAHGFGVDEGPHEKDQVYEQDDAVMVQEEPIPEAEAFPQHEEHIAFQDDERPAPARRMRRSRTIQRDEETQLSRNTIRMWQNEYLENCCGNKGRSTTTEAKRNAMLLTFGLGLGNIGRNIGIPGTVHPLGLVYSGDSLFTAFTGLNIPKKERGRRRSASDAIEDSAEQEERRVRPRLEDEDAQQQGPNIGRGDEMGIDPFVGHIPSEVGREAEAPMSEGHHSSAMPMPWNRGSSAVPGSSIRGGPGSAQKGRVLSSPLHNRRRPQDIERFSDDMPMGDFGSDRGDLTLGAGIGSQDSSFHGFLAVDPADAQTGEGGTKLNTQQQNEYLRKMLDREGQNFLSFIEETVRGEVGERREDDDFAMNRKWVGFNDLFVPSETTRATAAQAFYHTLCLTTREKLYVEQEVVNNEPFGNIWIGAKIDPAAM
ncbi:Rec8 like protein-domain-containing protein [Biscogniauxia sp. FL1348]|nr:Rec8 like protein-domain-containing protein [Biscogniauxia sp. FL1348]